MKLVQYGGGVGGSGFLCTNSGFLADPCVLREIAGFGQAAH